MMRDQRSTEAEDSVITIPIFESAYSVLHILIYAQISDIRTKKPKNIRVSPKILQNIDCARSPNTVAKDARTNFFGVPFPAFDANSKQF